MASGRIQADRFIGHQGGRSDRLTFFQRDSFSAVKISVPICDIIALNTLDASSLDIHSLVVAFSNPYYIWFIDLFCNKN